MDKTQNEFITKINEVYDKCNGSEQYGDTTEFYDEDGVVLMTVTEDLSTNKLTFSFSDNNENYIFDEDTAE